VFVPGILAVAVLTIVLLAVWAVRVAAQYVESFIVKRGSQAFTSFESLWKIPPSPDKARQVYCTSCDSWRLESNVSLVGVFKDKDGVELLTFDCDECNNMQESQVEEREC